MITPGLPIIKEADILAEEIANVRDILANSKEKIILDFPNIDKNTDVRVTAFNKLINVMISAQLSCAFWHFHLGRDERIQSATTYPKEDNQLLRDCYKAFMEIGIIQLSYSAIESSFRCIMRAIDPTAHNGSTGNFDPIFTNLFTSRLSSPKLHYIELLHFLAYLRNTIHNNGVFYHSSHSNKNVIYRGSNYTFEIGKVVNFISLNLLIEALTDAANMLDDVINDPSVISIAGVILDPSI